MSNLSETPQKGVSLFEIGEDTQIVSVNTTPNLPLEKAWITKHEFRKPTFEQEIERERTAPLITYDMGKVQGSVATRQVLDDEAANVKFYNNLIEKVYGYNKPGEPVSEEGLYADEELEYGGQVMTIAESIPVNHKNTAVNGLLYAPFELDTDEFQGFTLGGGREWRIRQEIGGRNKLEDGTLSEPDYVITYTLKEPSESENRMFRNQVFTALQIQNKKGQIEEKRTVNLGTIRDLFNKLIVDVKGFSVKGQPFDVRNPEHKKHILGSYMKGVIIKLFASLQSDLGN